MTKAARTLALILAVTIAISGNGARPTVTRTTTTKSATR